MSDPGAVVGEVGDKFMRARCRLMVRDPFYGHVAMSIEWMESNMDWLDESQRTAGVRFVDGGRIQCIYNPGFVAQLSVEQCYGLIMHELEHVIRLHPVRLSDRDPSKFNIAADICVNGKRSKPRCAYTEGNKVVVPSENGIYCPEDWPDDETAEDYYDRFPGAQLKAKQPGQCPKCGKQHSKKNDKKGQGQKGQGQKGDDQGQGGGAGGDQDSEGDGDDGDDECDGQPDPNQKGQSKGGKGPVIDGEVMDAHDLWKDSNVAPDEARQIVKDVVNQAAEKSMGKVPGHLAEWLKELSKPIIRWQEVLRLFIGRHTGNRRMTHSRRNRRRDEFGLPGISHHASSTMNIIVDTSGSVSTDELKQFFAEIDAISYRTKIRILQWDAAFQGYDKYRRGDWKTFQIKGRSGTDMAAPVKWLEENGLIADVQLMLTDGECNWPEKRDFPMLFCISAQRSGRIAPPNWGTVLYLDK